MANLVRGLVALYLAALPAEAVPAPPESPPRPAPFGFKVQHMGSVKNGPRTSPGGRLTVKVLDALTAQVVEAESGRPVGPVLRHRPRREGMRINTWAFSADGRFLATASSESADKIDTVGEVRVWDVGTGRLLAEVNDVNHAIGLVHAVAFAEDNRTVLVRCNDISGK
jgi:hypothetical protein